MSDLIDGILSLSRIDREEVQCDEIDLSAMAKHLLEGLSGGAQDRKVKWQVEDGLVAYGDARMVESVMERA